MTVSTYKCSLYRRCGGNDDKDAGLMPGPCRAGPPSGAACSSCSRRSGFNPPKPAQLPRAACPEPRPAKAQARWLQASRACFLTLALLTLGARYSCWGCCHVQSRGFSSTPVSAAGCHWHPPGGTAKSASVGKQPRGARGRSLGLAHPTQWTNSIAASSEQSSSHGVTHTGHPPPGASILMRLPRGCSVRMK